MSAPPFGFIEKEVALLLLWALQRAVMNVGGDGWGYVVSPHYKELAELFLEIPDGWKHITYDEKRVNITEHETSQENIAFLPPEARDLIVYPDIILEIP